MKLSYLSLAAVFAALVVSGCHANRSAVQTSEPALQGFVASEGKIVFVPTNQSADSGFSISGPALQPALSPAPKEFKPKPMCLKIEGPNNSATRVACE